MTIIIGDVSSLSRVNLIKNLISKNNIIDKLLIIGNSAFEENFNKIDNKVIYINIDELENPSGMKYTDSKDFNPFDYQKFRDHSKLLSDSFTRLGSLYYDIHNVEISILKLYLFFKLLISDYSIDLYLSFSVPHFPPHLALFYCMEIMGKKNIYVWHTGLKNKVYLSSSLESTYSDYVHSKKVQNKNIKEITKEILELIQLTSNPKELTPEYMKNIKGRRLGYFLASIVSRVNLLISRHESILSLYLAQLLRKSLQGGEKFLNYLKTVSIDAIPSLPYVYVPLHMQPEATTLPMGNKFHQLDLYLVTILSYIPTNLLIIVKENPKQTFRSRNKQYINLFENSRICVINNNLDTYSLIKQSKLIVTISGTVALEASLLGKKTLIFGNTPYTNLPNTFHINGNHNLLEKFINEPAFEVNILSFKKYIEEISKTAFYSMILSESKTSSDSDINNTAVILSKVIDCFKSI